jgi:hypothetical protein
MQALEDQLGDSPAEALPELDDLVARMLAECGYALDDPVTREGDEREVVSEYLAAHELTDEAERGSEELSPGDVAAAVNGFRSVFDYLISERAAADSAIEDDEV